MTETDLSQCFDEAIKPAAVNDRAVIRGLSARCLSGKAAVSIAQDYHPSGESRYLREAVTDKLTA